MKTKIENVFGEKLDILISGNKNAERVIIYVHGYGTDKHEGFATFSDLADFLDKDFLSIRFDLSGYGESEGEDHEFQFQKAAGDVDSIIRYVRSNYPNKRICLMAHSLGTFVVSLLSPYQIEKIVFTSIPNSNTDFIIKELKKRIVSKGGRINERGFSFYHRSSGAFQVIGKDFWRTLRHFDPCRYLEDLGHKTKLIIFKPIQDDVLANKYFAEYKKVKGVTYVEIDGDHNFTNKSNRKNLFEKIRSFFLV